MEEYRLQNMAKFAEADKTRMKPGAGFETCWPMFKYGSKAVAAGTLHIHTGHKFFVSVSIVKIYPEKDTESFAVVIGLY